MIGISGSLKGGKGYEHCGTEVLQLSEGLYRSYNARVLEFKMFILLRYFINIVPRPLNKEFVNAIYFYGY